MVFSSPLISAEEGFIIRGKPVSCNYSSFPTEPLMAHINHNHSETTPDPLKSPWRLFEHPLNRLLLFTSAEQDGSMGDPGGYFAHELFRLTG